MNVTAEYFRLFWMYTNKLSILFFFSLLYSLSVTCFLFVLFFLNICFKMFRSRKQSLLSANGCTKSALYHMNTFTYCKLQNKSVAKQTCKSFFFVTWMLQTKICSSPRMTAAGWSNGEAGPSPSPRLCRRGRGKGWCEVTAKRWNWGSLWGRDGFSGEAGLNLKDKNKLDVINQSISLEAHVIISTVKSYLLAGVSWPCCKSLLDELLVENCYINKTIRSD